MALYFSALPVSKNMLNLVKIYTMKKYFRALTVATVLLVSAQSYAQPTASLSMHPSDAKPIASPRDSIVATTTKGATITITYGSPGLWGRKMGEGFDPAKDSVWRAGANEATTFEVNKEVTIEGKKLPAGKYAFFAIKHDNQWTLIFNKVWNTWGAYSYKQNMGSDALQVKVMQANDHSYNERLKYMIASDGKVSMMWGASTVTFAVN